VTDVHAIAGTLLHAGTRPIATRHGTFTLHVLQDLTRRTYAMVMALGDVTSAPPLLARVHSSCVTSEGYGGCDCDCAEQLDAALAAIAAAGRGAVFYLDQEGRGAGFAAKVRDRMLVQASRNRLSTFEAYAEMGLAADLRAYDGVAAARRVLGITAPLTLLTNNPEKLATLTALGVPLAGSRGLALAASSFNQHYLAAKAAAGHALEVANGAEAEPPEPVEAVMPRPVAGAPHLVGLGTYWLPVRDALAARSDSDALAAPSDSDASAAPSASAAVAARPHWFRLHAYADLASGRERVVLAYGDEAARAPLIRVQREAVVERFPWRERGVEKARWAAAVQAFVARGAGVAVMIGDEGCAAILSAGDAVQIGGDATTVALLAHHIGSGEAVPLLDGPSARGVETERARALAAAGVALAAPRFLTDG
jgi:3,4-dihydroxy 2-butanone 4-phosphate synthase / GTP cyclohydrolase II